MKWKDFYKEMQREIDEIMNETITVGAVDLFKGKETVDPEVTVKANPKFDIDISYGLHKKTKTDKTKKGDHKVVHPDVSSTAQTEFARNGKKSSFGLY